MSSTYSAREHLFTHMQEVPTPNGLCTILQLFRDYTGSDFNSFRDTCKTIRSQTTEERLLKYERNIVFMNPECIKRIKLIFIHDLEKLPSSLRELHLGDDFNQSLSPGVLSRELEKIYFGYDFNQSLEPGVLPSGLRELHLDVDYNQFLSPEVYRVVHKN